MLEPSLRSCPDPHGYRNVPSPEPSIRSFGALLTVAPARKDRRGYALGSPQVAMPRGKRTRSVGSSWSLLPDGTLRRCSRGERGEQRSVGVVIPCPLVLLLAL